MTPHYLYSFPHVYLPLHLYTSLIYLTCEDALSVVRYGTCLFHISLHQGDYFIEEQSREERK